MQNNHEIEQAVNRSQHCQRNWDLTQSIPENDLETLITAATQCPSKQNIAYYKLHFITNREIIEKLYSHTDGFIYSYEPMKSTTNSQVLANLLVVFESQDVQIKFDKEADRNLLTRKIFVEKDLNNPEVQVEVARDRHMAVGIAAGYLNLSANLLGYSTGCCACYNTPKISEVLNLQGTPLLLMGIGFKNENLGRRVHHKIQDFVFPTLPKQKIEVALVK